MSLRVQYQPIPALSPSDSAWAWTVSDGTFVVGRFNSKEYADTFKAALIGSATHVEGEARTVYGQEACAAEDKPLQINHLSPERRAIPVITRSELEKALQCVSRRDTETILERLGYTEQEIADAIR